MSMADDLLVPGYLRVRAALPSAAWQAASVAVATVGAELRDGMPVDQRAQLGLRAPWHKVGSTVVPTASEVISGAMTRFWFALVPEVPKNEADELPRLAVRVAPTDAEELRWILLVAHELAAVGARELRDRRLLRGGEGGDLRHRRQRLLHRGVERRDHRVVDRYSGRYRHRGIDLGEEVHPEVRLRRVVGHRRIRRHDRIDVDVRLTTELVERQEEHVVGDPEVDADHRADAREQLTVRGRISRAADRGIHGRERLPDRRNRAVDADPDAGESGCSAAAHSAVRLMNVGS